MGRDAECLAAFERSISALESRPGHIPREVAEQIFQTYLRVLGARQAPDEVRALERRLEAWRRQLEAGAAQR